MIRLVNISVCREPVVDRMRSNDSPFITYKPSDICVTTLSFKMKEGFDCTALIDKISKINNVTYVDFATTLNTQYEECDDYGNVFDLYDEYIHELEISIESEGSLLSSIKDVVNDSYFNN